MGREALNVRRSSENGGIRQGLVAVAPGLLPNRIPPLDLRGSASLTRVSR